ncbi:MAG: endo alpha-1,4 polygalactosaminidase, partial [Proteocatella sp.]
MRFKILIVLLASLLSLSAFLSNCNKENDYKGNIILKQRNYIIYYNKINDENIHNIYYYDMAIIEPTNVTSKQLRVLNKYNTLTYGYQSIFQVEPYNREKVDSLNENDYLYINGVKKLNEEYQCYYGDIRSDNYKNVLLSSIEKNIIQKGFDGVFFDTLEDIEHLIDKPFREDLYAGYIEFFKLLKTKYPKLSIIQNRAFDLYN